MALVFSPCFYRTFLLRTYVFLSYTFGPMSGDMCFGSISELNTYLDTGHCYVQKWRRKFWRDSSFICAAWCFMYAKVDCCTCLLPLCLDKPAFVQAKPESGQKLFCDISYCLQEAKLPGKLTAHSLEDSQQLCILSKFVPAAPEQVSMWFDWAKVRRKAWSVLCLDKLTTNSGFSIVATIKSKYGSKISDIRQN